MKKREQKSFKTIGGTKVGFGNEEEVGTKEHLYAESIAELRPHYDYGTC